jgi:predicted ATPase
MRFPEYEDIQELTRNDRYSYNRARLNSSQETVLLKLPLRSPATPGELDLLEREFALLRQFSIPGIPRARELRRGRDGLLLEDGGGAPLQALLVQQGLSLETFFKIALQLSATLGELQRRHVIHNALNPRSIFVHPKTYATEIVDFSFAAPTEGETQPLAPLHVPGMLAYMSPEQTGRMNRAVDYRADFYSLGITFYEMLTGACPFRSDDSLELIHCHIARTPVPPAELDPNIPETLSRMVMKLLAKTAEQRYQSAGGLKADLERCAQEWAGQREISTFVPGRDDVSDQFLVSQKLYGRDTEVEALLKAFDDTCAGLTAMMLVAGYSGIGKTSLIQELYRPIVRERGYFISGKFDQIARLPYGAFIQAFRSLCRQLLTEGEDQVAQWRARLLAALGANGGVISEVIPEIELLIGPQPAAPQLAPAESQNRFRLVIQNFVGALASKEHPLVLFLDDLQWADSATLALLQPLLASRDIQHLFLIGAYRDNEVDAAHPLVRALAGLQEEGLRLQRVALGPLRLDELALLICDTLHGEMNEVEPLARLVLQKTEGNPFFVIQFLKALHQAKLIEFDYERGRWTFHLEAIARAGMTDNVIDLMTRRIQRLSEKAQAALMLGACIGNQFDLDTLAIISQQSSAAVTRSLDEALDEGLILATENSYDAWPESPAPAQPTFAFLHDRVQQAAYTLIPDERRQLVHLTVGRLLLQKSASQAMKETSFDIVNHLNLGSSLMTEGDERERLARLNLSAGRRAKSSTAYEAALAYFNAGVALLREAQWRSQYELAFALYLEAAECEYLCGHFEEAERKFELLIGRAATGLDKAKVYRLRSLQYENLSRYAEALSIAHESLALFGVSFPDSTEGKQAALETEITTIQSLLDGREIASLIDLPVMTDPEIRMVMNTLTDIWSSTYILGDAVLARLISATMVRLSLVHGNSEESAYGYVTHAITVGPVRGDYESAYEFGKLALLVNERFNDSTRRAKIHQQFHAHVNLWRRPLETCIPYAREACRSGLESGDFLYAAYGASTEAWPAFLSTTDLRQFVRDYTPNLVLIEKLKATSFADALRILLNWARALAGETRAPLSLSYAEFNEQNYAETYKGNPFFTTFYAVARLHLCYVFGEYAQALEAARAARASVPHLSGTIWPVLFDFWHGLTLAANYPETLADEQATYLAEMEKAQRVIAALAENCPENFLCQWLLLSAEIGRLRGHEFPALTLYTRAIDYAEATASVQLRALANELCARFWLGLGQEKMAAIFIAEARQAYAQWGAAAKVAELERRHAELFKRQTGRALSMPVGSIVAPLTSPESLDVVSAVRAAQAVASESELEKLLGRLMRIAIENAGAERGSLIFEHDGEAFIQVEGSLDAVEIKLSAAVPLAQAKSLSQRVVNYVRRTMESVVLADATTDDRYATDGYIHKYQPRSIMCVPMLNQGRLIGAFYLENNLVTDAFTIERMRVVQLVASEAAISIENTRLYDEMRQEVARRRQAEDELRAALAEVETLKNRLEEENVYLQEEIRREHHFEEIVGSSPPLLALLSQLEIVAPTDSTVLIHGETGTGKELIARAVHDRSLRKGRPLVKVNCGAISAGLVESELFGHVKGAFTGAIERRVGRFELADGGTLFLDEVSELPLDTQVKLLRVLQEQEFEPVGSSRTVRVDVRIIAATNRPLEEAVRAGRFRQDLFYRLNVLPLRVPPLRERLADIPQLVMFFLSRFAKRFGKRIDRVAQESLQLLQGYPWPGNVRELQNIIERAVVLCQGNVLSLDRNLLPALEQGELPAALKSRAANAGPLPVSPVAPDTLSPPSSLEEVERRHILDVLKQTGWTIDGPNGAARLLSLHPNTLRSRMKRLGIQRPRHEIS